MNRVNDGSGRSPGPWNPGLRSPLPRAVQPLCTLFRPENAFTSLAEVRELSDFTGLPEVELVAFRPRRLAVHELLIRVAANLSIPDEEDTDALGVNFRRIARTIEERCFDSMSDALEADYEALRARVLARTSAAIDEVLAALETSPPAPRRGLRARLGLSTLRPPPEGSPSRIEREDEALACWRRRGTGRDREEAVTCRALVLVVDAVRARHGRIVGERDLLARMAAIRVCNEVGSERIGALLDSRIEAVIDEQGLRRLPAQERSVVMNCKGASASGKSSMRPRQRALAGRLGVDWADFAVLSPDIFRKYLLRLRRARRCIPICRHAHGGGACNRRSKARSPHGGKGGPGKDAPPADRSIPIRQLRARVRRTREQSAHSFRHRRLPLLHGDSTARHGGTGVGARPASGSLQERRRSAPSQRGSIHRHAGAALHLGPGLAEKRALRVPGQRRRPATKNRAPLLTARMAHWWCSTSRPCSMSTATGRSTSAPALPRRSTPNPAGPRRRSTSLSCAPASTVSSGSTSPIPGTPGSIFGRRPDESRCSTRQSWYRPRPARILPPL